MSYLLARVNRVRLFREIKGVFASIEVAFASAGVDRWKDAGDRYISIDESDEYFFEVKLEETIEICSLSKGQLQITESELYIDEAKNHYLYQLVPASVRIKVDKLLAAGKSVELPDRLKLQAIDDILADGDIILYPDKKNFDRVKQIYNELTDIIAILAFMQHGVEIFGYRYEIVDAT